jgi:hypothetical protein
MKIRDGVENDDWGGKNNVLYFSRNDNQAMLSQFPDEGNDMRHPSYPKDKGMKEDYSRYYDGKMWKVEYIHSDSIEDLEDYWQDICDWADEDGSVLMTSNGNFSKLINDKHIWLKNAPNGFKKDGIYYYVRFPKKEFD